MVKFSKNDIICTTYYIIQLPKVLSSTSLRCLSSLSAFNSSKLDQLLLLPFFFCYYFNIYTVNICVCIKKCVKKSGVLQEFCYIYHKGFTIIIIK